MKINNKRIVIIGDTSGIGDESDIPNHDIGKVKLPKALLRLSSSITQRIMKNIKEDNFMNKFYVILCGVFMLSANNAWATELKVKVNNIDIKRGGNIIVMIFGAEGFPKKHEMAFFTQSKNSRHETMEFSFNVNIKELAIKVLHDENGDGKVSKNWTGIWPKEGLGFSNGQKISLKGAPKYNNSKLLKEQFKDGINISITYP